MFLNNFCFITVRGMVETIMVKKNHHHILEKLINKTYIFLYGLSAKIMMNSLQKLKGPITSTVFPVLYQLLIPPPKFSLSTTSLFCCCSFSNNTLLKVHLR